MKKFIFNIFASLLLILSSMSSAFAAERYNLVLFYADWNVYSEHAIEVMEDVAKVSNKISFEKINVDDKKAFVRMKQLGVMPTNSIPYYFLMDKNKKVLYGSTYNNETAEKLMEELNNRIDD